MSGQVKDREKANPAEGGRREARAARREARLAAAKAAKRRQTLRAVGGAFVGVVLLIGFAFLVFRDNGAAEDPAASNAYTSTGNSAAPDANATDPNAANPDPAAPPADAKFPPLPAGADPALGTKPKTTKGGDKLDKLTVATLIEGKGAAVKSGDTIKVNYVGVSYTSGEEFDSSWSRSQAFDTAIGVGQVIPGWDQGLVGVKVGSRVQLDIPSELAYGDNGQVPGPLRFVVDVLAVS